MMEEFNNKAYKPMEVLGGQIGGWENTPDPEQFESPEDYAKWRKGWEEEGKDSRDV
jgi:hypothetical protein